MCELFSGALSVQLSVECDVGIGQCGVCSLECAVSSVEFEVCSKLFSMSREECCVCTY